MAEKRRKPIWIFAVVSLIGLMIIIKIVQGMNNSVVVSSVVVQESTVEAYVDEHARTSLPHVYHVTMPMQGRILPLQVAEGDEVRKGQLVAKMEDLDWRDALLEVESITTTFENWLEASSAQLKASKIRLEFDKWDWERHKQLAQKSAISEREQRDTKRNYLDSSVQFESSEAMYYATKALQSIVDLLPGYANRNFDRTTITSPVAGTILRRHVWNEKVMTAGAPLLDIGNLSELEVTADILTEEAVHIHPGDKVVIYGSSLEDKSLPGVIRLIEPNAFTKVSSLGVEEQRVAVKIAFTDEAKKTIEKEGLNLGLQYRVRVKIITDENKKTLAVPRTAIFYDAEGEWKLYRVENGRAKLTVVKTGLTNDLQAEIIAGLKEGDSVITVPQSNLADGVKVQSL
ncbi:MAG: efflux RND transporter periplasmic adaptor subunit [Desulfobulbaceae bacterium]|nr:efflux RND transporter periplasmic adaptor subunit [Desulfobulbaceae bacterium]